MLECDCQSFAVPLLKCSEWFYHASVQLLEYSEWLLWHCQVTASVFWLIYESCMVDLEQTAGLVTLKSLSFTMKFVQIPKHKYVHCAVLTDACIHNYFEIKEPSNRDETEFYMKYLRKICMSNRDCLNGVIASYELNLKRSFRRSMPHQLHSISSQISGCLCNHVAKKHKYQGYLLAINYQNVPPCQAPSVSSVVRCQQTLVCPVTS